MPFFLKSLLQTHLWECTASVESLLLGGAIWQTDYKLLEWTLPNKLSYMGLATSLHNHVPVFFLYKQSVFLSYAVKNSHDYDTDYDTDSLFIVQCSAVWGVDVNLGTFGFLLFGPLSNYILACKTPNYHDRSRFNNYIKYIYAQFSVQINNQSNHSPFSVVVIVVTIITI